jgi:hypothetical protein
MCVAERTGNVPLLSQGTQMVEVLNCCNVRAACVGNHDFGEGILVSSLTTLGVVSVGGVMVGHAAGCWLCRHCHFCLRLLSHNPNSLGVADYGVANFELRAAECNFPWLMANVLDVDSGSPLGGAIPTALFEWQGVQVGIVGQLHGGHVWVTAWQQTCCLDILHGWECVVSS